MQGKISIKSMKRNPAYSKRYLIVKEHLDRYGIRVAKWMPYNVPHAQVQYLADIDEGRVWIPFPVDNFSFYICMHEIGHIVTGSKSYAYLQEVAAEQYAIRKCKQYGMFERAIVRDAKAYVRSTIAEDVLFRGLDPKQINRHTLKWIGRNPTGVRNDAIKLAKAFRKAENTQDAHIRKLLRW